MKTITKLTLALAMTTGIATAGWAQETRGVSDTEVVVGSSNDLSGIFAAFGAPATKAAQMYFDEVNAKGGVHGRKIKFVVEDHAYSLPKATQAINKLVNRDKIFAMLLQLGTPMNIASFKLLEKNKIANVYPLSAARQLLQEPIDYRFTGAASYYDQIRASVKYLNKVNGSTKICSMFIPSDFGKEIQEGAKDEAAALGITYVAETTHKPDDADFVGSLTKLKDAGRCRL